MHRGKERTKVDTVEKQDSEPYNEMNATTTEIPQCSSNGEDYNETTYADEHDKHSDMSDQQSDTGLKETEHCIEKLERQQRINETVYNDKIVFQLAMLMIERNITHDIMKHIIYIVNLASGKYITLSDVIRCTESINTLSGIPNSITNNSYKNLMF